MTASDEAREMARIAVAAAADKLAQDIVALDVSDQPTITECLVFASASNERQVQAVVDEIEEKLRLSGVKATAREGVREARWVALDFDGLIVHVQLAEVRSHFGLDRHWKDCPRFDFPEAAATAQEDRS